MGRTRPIHSKGLKISSQRINKQPSLNGACPVSRTQKLKEKITEPVSGRPQAHCLGLSRCTALRASPLQNFCFMKVCCTLHYRDTPETSAPSLCTTLVFPRVRSLRDLTHPALTHRACPLVCPDVGGDLSEGKVRGRSGEKWGLLLLASGETQVTRREKLARPPFRSPGATSRHQHLASHGLTHRLFVWD